MRTKRSSKSHLQRIVRVRRENIGRLLTDSFRFFSMCTLRHLHAFGFPELKPTHLTLLRAIDVKGTRITEIAARVSVTKQAIAQLVIECEALGYVTRSVDPDDSRARIICFTKKGHRFVASGAKVVAAAMKDLESVVGPEQLRALKTTLRLIAAQARNSGANGWPQRKRSGVIS